MDIDVLREAGIEETDAVVVSTNGDNTNIVIGQVAQKRFGIHCVVVRVLDPARAEFYAERGLRTVCPTSTAIDVLTEAVRSLRGWRTRARGRPDVRPRRRRREGRRERDAPLLRSGHEVTLIEQRRDRFEQLEEEFEHEVQHGDATELFVLERAGIKRPPDLVLAVTGDDEDNMVITQLAKEKYGVQKVIARVNDPRNQAHFDLLGISPTVCATLEHPRPRRARGPRARPRPPARAAQGEPRDRRGADRQGLAGRAASASRSSRCPRARA